MKIRKAFFAAISAFFVFCVLAGFGTVAIGDDLDDLYFLISRVPKNHKIAYAGKVDKETFYLIFQSLDSSCSSLRLCLGKKENFKENAVRFVVCKKDESTIIKTAAGLLFYFPSLNQRQTGTKAALNAVIFLQELYFRKE